MRSQKRFRVCERKRPCRPSTRNTRVIRYGRPKTPRANDSQVELTAPMSTFHPNTPIVEAAAFCSEDWVSLHVGKLLKSTQVEYNNEMATLDFYNSTRHRLEQLNVI